MGRAVEIVLAAGMLLLTVPGGTAPAGEVSDTLVVAKILVLGNEQTKEDIILREMITRVGGPLVPESLDADRDRIYSLQLFNRVEIYHYLASGEATVVVNVHERWYVFPFPVLGFKYHSLRNLYYGAGITHQNFRGRNEKITFSFALGFDRWVDLSYSNPRIMENDYFLGVSLNVSRLQNLRPDAGLYHRQRISGSLSAGKRFGLYSALLGWIGYDVWRVPADLPSGTLSPDGQDQFPSAGVSYTVDTRDLREYASNGTYVMVHASKHGYAETSVDYIRCGFNAKRYQPLLTGMSLALRAHGSFTAGGAVPPYRFLYFGYDEKIRGRFRAVAEGEHLVGGNMELRVPLLRPIYIESPYPIIPEFSVWRFGITAALFVDAGKTWYRSEQFSERSWISGAGGGIHFLLPYSIVARAEYAISPGKTGEFILDLGASF